MPSSSFPHRPLQKKQTKPQQNKSPQNNNKTQTLNVAFDAHSECCVVF